MLSSHLGWDVSYRKSTGHLALQHAENSSTAQQQTFIKSHRMPSSVQGARVPWKQQSLVGEREVPCSSAVCGIDMVYPGPNVCHRHTSLSCPINPMGTEK